MQTKKEQLEHLSKILEEKIKIYFLAEIENRTARSEVFGVSKPDSNMLAMETKTRQTITLLKHQIRHIRDLMDEVKKDEFII